MQITNFDPASGDIGTQVTLSLTEMPADASADNTVVQLSGVPTVDVQSVNVAQDKSGTIAATIGENSQSGDFSVVVLSQNGAVDAQSAQVFTVKQPAGQPRITKASPAKVVAGQSQLTLTGTGLDEISYVVIGSVQVSALSYSGSTQIRFLVPSAVAAGPQRVYGISTQYGQVRAPLAVTVAAPGVGQAPAPAPPRGMGEAWVQGAVTLELRTPAGYVPFGEFRLDAGEVEGTDQRGISYRGACAPSSDGLLVTVTASVPAGVRIADGLLTEEPSKHELSFYLDQDHLTGQRTAPIALPGFGAADVRFTVQGSS
jgi:hypothetical protein